MPTVSVSQEIGVLQRVQAQFCSQHYSQNLGIIHMQTLLGLEEELPNWLIHKAGGRRLYFLDTSNSGVSWNNRFYASVSKEKARGGATHNGHHKAFNDLASYVTLKHSLNIPGLHRGQDNLTNSPLRGRTRLQFNPTKGQMEGNGRWVTSGVSQEKKVSKKLSEWPQNIPNIKALFLLLKSSRLNFSLFAYIFLKRRNWVTPSPLCLEISSVKNVPHSQFLFSPLM